MLKRHAIQVLRSAGHTLDEIVTLVAVGKRTVQRVIEEPMITSRLTGRGAPTADRSSVEGGGLPRARDDRADGRAGRAQCRTPAARQARRLRRREERAV